MDTNNIEIIEDGLYKIRGQIVKLDCDLAKAFNLDITELRKTVEENESKFWDINYLKVAATIFIDQNNNSFTGCTPYNEELITKYTFELTEEEFAKLKVIVDENQYKFDSLPLVFTEKGEIILSVLIEKREYTQDELSCLEYLDYQQNRIEIYYDIKSKKEYVFHNDISANLFFQMRNGSLPKYSEDEKDINNVDDYLLNLESFELDLLSRESEDILIGKIESELLFSINKDKYSLYFTRLFQKLSRSYDLLIDHLKCCVPHSGCNGLTLKDAYIERTKILSSIELIYSLLKRINKLALQEGINVLQIIEKENLEYLFIESEIDNEKLIPQKKEFSISSNDIKYSKMELPVLDRAQIVLLFKYLRNKKIVGYSTNVMYSKIINLLTGYSHNTIRQEIGKEASEYISKQKISQIVDLLNEVISSLEKEKLNIIK